jgi:hypothetical protein
MKPPDAGKSVFKALLFFVLLNPTQFSFSQEIGNTKPINHFGGAASVTNNGISLLPTFSLGKPAAIFDMSVGRKLRFEPQFRFALEGKPWSFIFWWRYELLKTGKFQIAAGAHPAVTFKTVAASTNGVSKEMIAAQRYWAGELSPNYLLAKNISVGSYYLYSHGMEKDAIRNTHFLTLRSNFSNLKLSNQFFMRLTPQFYYLKMDKQDGFYFTSTLTLVRRNVPLSISSIINKTIQTTISASKDFVWNVTLIYSFNKKFVEL